MERLLYVAIGVVIVGLSALMLPGTTPAPAAELAAPEGEVILTVAGAVADRNAGDRAEFDLAMLEALPRTTIKTATPWTTGSVTFEGVALSDLLQAVGATGATIVASALNDYAVNLPASDAQSGAVIAYRLNGDYMSVREKGPLWIVYPFDSNPSLKSETIYSRCVWQLKSLRIE
jgi:hypothetical protein